MYKLLRSFRVKQNHNFVVCRRHNSNAIGLSGARKEVPSTAKSIESFKDVVFRRRSQVERSIIVRVDHLDSSKNVYHYCKQFGEIRNAIAYTMKEDRNLVLIEFEHKDSVSEAFKYSGFPSDRPAWADQYLSLRKSALIESNSRDAPLQYDCVHFASVEDILSKAETLDQQILLLYEHTGVNEIATRLKFMSAMQAETIANYFMPTIFPKVKIYPFGSTLNGFGQRGCDLDMALHYDRDTKGTNRTDNSVLNFHTRSCRTEEDFKALAGRQVKCLAALIDHYVPGITPALAFSSARVPIVRYYDTNVPCSVDISIMNVDGFLATELMYSLGILDPRVRPFVFLARRWAKEFKLTRHGPGDYFTNFQISYMALSFLQNVEEPVIPTFDNMIQAMNANGTDKFEDFSKKSFIFDMNHIRFQSKNTDSIFDLFLQFLEYYEAFDFEKNMLSLSRVGKIAKIDSRSLHLENMFRKEAVWGDNVSRFECNTLQIMIRETLDELSQINLEPGGEDTDWGLLGLLTHLKRT